MWVPKRDYSSREQRQIRKKPKNTRANIWDIALANTLSAVCLYGRNSEVLLSQF